MYRKFVAAALLVSLVCWSFESALSQVGGPPPRNRPRPPNNNQPPPGPSAEDILKLLFPPEQYFPNDGNEDDVPARPRQPRVLSSNEVARLSPYQQRALLRKAVQSLDENFDRLKTGAGWKKHLQLEKLGSSVWCGKSVSPDAKTRTAMAAIAKRFDAIAKDPKYKSIPNLWGFKTIRAALSEYAIDPIELSRREVRANSRKLLQSLGNMRTGASWKKYLQTDELARLAKSKMELADDDEDILRKIIEQYKKVDENPRYRVIARLDGFASTRRNVEELADQVMKLKPSTSSAGARRMMKALSKTMRSANRAQMEERKAQKAMKSATAGSSDAETAKKVLMAIKQNHDEEKKLTEEQVEKLRQFIAQTAKENEAKRKARDAKGILTLLPAETRVMAPEVRVLPLEDDDADRKQMMSKLVASMRSVKKINKEQKSALMAWKKVSNTPEAEKAKEVLMSKKLILEKEKSLSKEQIDRLKQFMSQQIEKEKASRTEEDAGGKLKLLPIEDEEEEGVLTLMQFDDEDDSEEPAYVLMQFEDVEDSDEGATITLMQFKEVTESEAEEVWVMQFKEATESEPEETVLMQFSDVLEEEDDESKKDKKKNKKDDKKGNKENNSKSEDDDGSSP